MFIITNRELEEPAQPDHPQVQAAGKVLQQDFSPRVGTVLRHGLRLHEKREHY